MSQPSINLSSQILLNAKGCSEGRKAVLELLLLLYEYQTRIGQHSFCATRNTLSQSPAECTMHAPPLPPLPCTPGRLQRGVSVLLRDSIKMTRSLFSLLFHCLLAFPVEPTSHLWWAKGASSHRDTQQGLGRSIFGKLLSSYSNLIFISNFFFS